MSTDNHSLMEAKALLAQNWTQARIARHLGITTPTLCRWLKQEEEIGRLGEKEINNGQPSSTRSLQPSSTHSLTADEHSALKLGMIQKRSRRLAAEFLLHHASCTDATFALLTAVLDSAADKRIDPVWPSWFKRACILTDEERFSFRGAKALAAVDPTLRGAADAARGRALHPLGALHEKSLRALKKRDQARADRLRRTRDALFPGGAFQERGLSLIGLLARHGLPLLADALGHLDPWARGHQVISL